MNSKERVLAAANHRITARVPITFDAAEEIYSALYKYLGIETKEELFNALHVDTWMILPGNFVYTREEENKIEKTTVWGHKTIVKEFPGGAYDEICFNPLAGKDEISDDISCAALARMLESHGDGIDIVYMADDYCSQDAPMFSPEDFKQLIAPYLRKLVAITHRYNKKFLIHVCGAVRPLLPLLIDAGVDMLEPIQIRAAGMEPAGLKKDFGKDICFYGGIDIQQILNNGTPDQVSSEVKRLIDIMHGDGGYILGPGHTYIQIDTPVENILTMYETAFTYLSSK